MPVRPMSFSGDQERRYCERNCERYSCVISASQGRHRISWVVEVLWVSVVYSHCCSFMCCVTETASFEVAIVVAVAIVMTLGVVARVIVLVLAAAHAGGFVGIKGDIGASVVPRIAGSNVGWLATCLRSKAMSSCGGGVAFGIAESQQEEGLGS